MAQLAGQYGVCETVICNRLAEAGADPARDRLRAGRYRPARRTRRPDRHRGDAMTGTQPEAAWLGYSFRELHQIAARATVYCRRGDRFAFPERFEIGWTGVVGHLAGCEEPPGPSTCTRPGCALSAGPAARSCASTASPGAATGSRRCRASTPTGRTRPLPLPAPPWSTGWRCGRSGRCSARCTRWPSSPWPRTATTPRPRSRRLPCSSFSTLISQARAAFLELWHEGGTPSRIWAVGKHGNGDPALT